MRRTNWAGNVTYATDAVVAPDSVDAVRAAVGAAARVRPLGSRHSFSAIGDTDGLHVSMDRLNRIVGFDPERRRVTVEGGIRYGDLAPALHARGFALANLASLPHISVVGACATATHGSGSANGNLATAVAALTFVDAGGELVRLSRDGNSDVFPGAVVNLGALGIVTEVTLDLEPSFEIRQNVFRDLPFATLCGRFDEVMDAAYSVSIFTAWRGETAEMAWTKRRAGEAPGGDGSFFGARAATAAHHPLADHDAVNCTAQFGRPGPWHERLPHFRLAFTPSSGEEIQAEYFVPRTRAAEAIAALRLLASEMAPVLMISEIRTVAADSLWMSPHREPSAAFHFTFRRDPAAVVDILSGIEEALGPLGARPHWGKVFAMPPSAIRARYPQFGAFRELVRTHDPDGRFANPWLDSLLAG